MNTNHISENYLSYQHSEILLSLIILDLDLIQYAVCMAA